jgi:endonuclease/exonuclease/phosphatase family metal-dependent hydrolase
MAYLANIISPVSIWPIAFFGLGYPFILLVNIGFILLWILRMKLLALISIFIVLAGWTNVGRYMQIRIFDNPSQTQNGIKLLSYNVRTFNHYNWEKGNSVRDSILKYIVGQEAGIVCFQEFFTHENRYTQSLRYINAKLKQLPFTHIQYTYHGKESSNYGIATFSKYPIVKKGTIKFNNSFNSCIYSDIVVKSDTIRIYNVHLESIKLRKNSYKFLDSLMFNLNSKQIHEVKDISGRLKNAYIIRALQVDELNKHIRQSPYPVVICGDFNDTPVSYTYQELRGELEDAFMSSGSGIGNTYRGNFPSFRIDYIFHSKKIKSVNYQTHRLNSSDHYPVSCSLLTE